MRLYTQQATGVPSFNYQHFMGLGVKPGMIGCSMFVRRKQTCPETRRKRSG
jgi:hypothetical protein